MFSTYEFNVLLWLYRLTHAYSKFQIVGEVFGWSCDGWQWFDFVVCVCNSLCFASLDRTLRTVPFFHRSMPFFAYHYGYQFALVATFVSAMLGSFFFAKPYFSFDIATTADIIQFINFASVTVISVLIIERLQRSIYERQMVLKIMESRHKIALYRENDRIHFSKKNNEAWSILDEILTDFDDIIFLKFDGGNVKPEPLFLALAKSDPVTFQGDTWQTLIYPEDLPLLLSKLQQAATTPGLISVFDLRFSSQISDHPFRVQLEAYEFLGKPLKILRLASS